MDGHHLVRSNGARGGVAMMALETEIRTYEAKIPELERHYSGKFVVIHGENFVGGFDTFENAAAEAVVRFGRGPYLIRQIGAPAPTLPTS
jgi:hypothetical protein